MTTTIDSLTIFNVDTSRTISVTHSGRINLDVIQEIYALVSLQSCYELISSRNWSATVDSVDTSLISSVKLLNELNTVDNNNATLATVQSVTATYITEVVKLLSYRAV